MPNGVVEGLVYDWLVPEERAMYNEFNPEQLALLINRDVWSWNAWREKHPDPSQLSPIGAARCAHVKIDLSYTDWSNASLGTVDLRGARLKEADFSGARMSSADLRGAWLEDANLAGAYLQNADFRSAYLIGADLTGADLRRANFLGADLAAVIFNGADIRSAVGIRFDSNQVVGTRFTLHPRMALRGWVRSFLRFPAYFDPGGGAMRSGPTRRAMLGSLKSWRQLLFLFSSPADDPWSYLRRTYTGSAYVLVLLALLVFLVPRILTGTGLYLLDASEDLASRLINLSVPHAATGYALQGENPGREAAPAASYPVWKVLLGIREGTIDEWMSVLLIVLLLIYNVGRFWLTRQITPLRDAEERSGVTPAIEDYWPLYRMHRRLAPIWILAITTAVFNLWRFIVWAATTEVALIAY